MVDERSKQANRTSAGRWTAAVALFAGTVTVLAACGGGASGGSATESSEPVIRGKAVTASTSNVTAVDGTNSGEVVVSWSGSGPGYVVQKKRTAATTARSREVGAH